jgi:hypothetical protein
MDDKALEKKAREWVAGVAEHECGAYIGSPCPTCDYRIPRLLVMLREVAEEARREAQAEVERLRDRADAAELNERIKLEATEALAERERARADDHDSARQAEKERADYAEAEVERLLEIKAYAEKAYEELRADLTAKVERLEHELDDAKRSRDDAIGRYVESQQ